MSRRRLAHVLVHKTLGLQDFLEAFQTNADI